MDPWISWVPAKTHLAGTLAGMDDVHPVGRVTDRYYLCSPAPIEIPRYNPGQAIFLSLIILVPLLYLMYDFGPPIIF